MEYAKIELDLFKRNELMQVLINICNHIAKDFNQNIININLEKVFISEYVYWINVDFIIKTKNSAMLAEMNCLLSKRIAQEEHYLQSQIEFIPSFLSSENT